MYFHSSTCGSPDHFSRRTLLQAAGASGLLWLTPLAERLARAAEAAPRGAPAQSVIFLWLAGGPSQLDTFDPKPGTKIGGPVQGVKSALPGCELAADLARVAEQMDVCTLVRSVTSKEGDHERATYTVKTGYSPDPTLVHPALGAILCHELPEGKTEIPRHISIVSSAWPARGGDLGDKYDAFQLSDPLFPLPDVTPRVSEQRTAERLSDLAVLEQSFARGRIANLERDKTLHQATIQKARLMMTSEQRKAFEVSNAPLEQRQEFGENPFGRGCLAAARLIREGVRCVEITMHGFDSHINNYETQKARLAELDPALSALLKHLRSEKDAGGRPLLDSTIVICGGEFGRTPIINPAEGRDHWPHGFSILLAGGGFRRGYLHGATDPEGAKDNVHQPIKIADLHATLLSALGIEYDKSFDAKIGRPMKYSEGQPRKELLG